MSPLSTPSQQGYHVQTVQPLTFILQLPNSSVRCNCASHQPELGLLNCPHNHSFYVNHTFLCQSLRYHSLEEETVSMSPLAHGSLGIREENVAHLL